MVNRLKMAKVQSILSLYAHGWSGRRIARELFIDRETVLRYVRLHQQAGAGGSSTRTVFQNHPMR